MKDYNANLCPKRSDPCKMKLTYCAKCKGCEKWRGDVS